MRILCLDCGSSSLKLAVYDLDGCAENLMLAGAAEGLAQGKASFWLRDGSGALLQDKAPPGTSWDATSALEAIFESLRVREMRPDAVGHRIVFGGPDHIRPERITPRLIDQLERLIPFDPLHLPGELKIATTIGERFSDLPQVACFDTAFHRRMPEIAKRLPLPRDVGRMVQRYGYHGLSYEYIAGAVGAIGRLVIAHLGNGASLAALKDGVPVDTTMGFSPLGGLMMGTRPGDLDPGALLYLLTEGGYDAQHLSELLSKRSGLLGVSGISASMQTLLERSAGEPNAAAAVELFVYLTRKFIGAMTAALGGLDMLVFTGGIGERAARVRAMIGEGLAFLDVRIDPDKNAAHAETISRSDSAVAVRVIVTNENLMVARHTRSLLTADGLH